MKCQGESSGQERGDCRGVTIYQLCDHESHFTFLGPSFCSRKKRDGGYTFILGRKDHMNKASEPARFPRALAGYLFASTNN